MAHYYPLGKLIRKVFGSYMRCGVACGVYPEYVKVIARGGSWSTPAARRIFAGLGVRDISILEHLPDTQHSKPLPSKDDYILLSRKNDVPTADIIYSMRHYKVPFDWGDDSDGSRELALNILATFTDPDTAMRYHEKFHDDVLRAVPYDGQKIWRVRVQAWMKRVPKRSVQ